MTFLRRLLGSSWLVIVEVYGENVGEFILEVIRKDIDEVRRGSCGGVYLDVFWRVN